MLNIRINLVPSLMMVWIILALSGCSKKAMQLGVGDNEQQEDVHSGTSRKNELSENQQEQHDLRVKRWIEDIEDDEDKFDLVQNLIRLNPLDLPDFLNREDIKKLVAHLCKDEQIDDPITLTLIGYYYEDQALDANQFIAILSALSALEGTSSVSKLNLDSVGLCRLDPQILYEGFSALKKSNVEGLGLGFNRLGTNGSSFCTILSALEGTPVRSVDLCYNELGLLSPQALYEGFSALKKTKVEELILAGSDLGTNGSSFCTILSALEGTPVRRLRLDDLNDIYDDDEGSFDLTTEMLRKALFALKNTKVDRVWLDQVTRETCPNWLVNEFNTQIAYPHEAIYRSRGLKSVSIRAIRKAMPDLDRVGELPIPPKLQETIRTYDEPGLFVERYS